MLRHDAPLELHHIDILLPVDEDAVTPRGGGHFLGQVGFLAYLHSVFAETLAPALSPGGFADKAGVRYAGGGLLPLALAPICFGLRPRRCHPQQLIDGRWEGGRWGIKQVSLPQMTHDMVLRPGPLFMASHVSKGWLPWGAKRLSPSGPAFSRPSRAWQTHGRIPTRSTR